MCTGKLQELADRKPSIEKQKVAPASQERKKGEHREAAEAIAEFASNFRLKFADVDNQKRKEVIQRCLEGIVSDRTAKVACCTSGWCLW